MWGGPEFALGLCPKPSPTPEAPSSSFRFHPACTYQRPGWWRRGRGGRQRSSWLKGLLGLWRGVGVWAWRGSVRWDRLVKGFEMKRHKGPAADRRPRVQPASRPPPRAAIRTRSKHPRTRCSCRAARQIVRRRPGADLLLGRLDQQQASAACCCSCPVRGRPPTRLPVGSLLHPLPFHGRPAPTRTRTRLRNAPRRVQGVGVDWGLGGMKQRKGGPGAAEGAKRAQVEG